MANLKDYATATVLTAPSPATSGTSLILSNGEGALMPTPPFYATAHPDNNLPQVGPNVNNAEKILVTAISTDTLTIVRAQGSTTAKSIAGGWRISNTIFAADLYNGTMVNNEIPSGSINGTNVAFNIAAAFAPGTLAVYLNGKRLVKGSGNDYTENSSLTGFTMQYAPVAGDVLMVDYAVGSMTIMQGTNVFINQETPTGAVNGTNVNYTTARAYISGTLEVYVNGLLQAKTTHVTEVSPTAGTFTLDVAPATGDIVRVSYQYAISTGGNAATVNGINASTTPTANQLLPLNANGKFPIAALGGITPTTDANGWTVYNFGLFMLAFKSKQFSAASVGANTTSFVSFTGHNSPVAYAASTYKHTYAVPLFNGSAGNWTLMAETGSNVPLTPTTNWVTRNNTGGTSSTSGVLDTYVIMVP